MSEESENPTWWAFISQSVAYIKLSQLLEDKTKDDIRAILQDSIDFTLEESKKSKKLEKVFVPIEIYKILFPEKFPKKRRRNPELRKYSFMVY
ncbi:MAG: hypothetical protein ACD_4C00125G0003 [uncultured bacterium (gcode 4)]|uniref:Uncharacterized protein n=1 Tax=uncultured bacterium (gcode 4) TaxID=1234023 RepID=K2GU82_9BACT|nr:MAG: hypothetical protein ACD_4C00125G0003 [uncultured bacterium (gcode 4)]